jgi:hypothetical protein
VEFRRAGVGVDEAVAGQKQDVVAEQGDRRGVDLDGGGRGVLGTGPAQRAGDAVAPAVDVGLDFVDGAAVDELCHLGVVDGESGHALPLVAVGREVDDVRAAVADPPVVEAVAHHERDDDRRVGAVEVALADDLDDAGVGCLDGRRDDRLDGRVVGAGQRVADDPLGQLGRPRRPAPPLFAGARAAGARVAGTLGVAGRGDLPEPALGPEPVGQPAAHLDRRHVGGDVAGLGAAGAVGDDEHAAAAFGVAVPLL